MNILLNRMVNESEYINEQDEEMDNEYINEQDEE